MTALIRAFVVLVAAAGCAVVVFFLPAEKLKKLWKETRVERPRKPEAPVLD